MPFKIRPKRTATAGRKPTAAQLDTGEIALNMADKKLYFKDQTGAVKELNGSVPAQQPTNLGRTITNTQITITSSTGTDAVIPSAGASAGVMTTAQVADLAQAKADNTAQANQLAKANSDITTLTNRLNTTQADITEVFESFMDLEDLFEAFKTEVRGLIASIPTPPVQTPTLSYNLTVTAAGISKTTTVSYKFGEKVAGNVSIQPLTGKPAITSMTASSPPAGYRLHSARAATYYKSAAGANVVGPFQGCQVNGTSISVNQAGGIPVTYTGANLYSIRVYLEYVKI
jgi:hypothetical protein